MKHLSTIASLIALCAVNAWSAPPLVSRPASGHVTGSHAGYDGPHFKGVRTRPGERR
jgi:hypothetical protein